MTTTRKAPRPTNCDYCGRKLTSSTRSPEAPESCTVCYDAAGWENDHNDGGHEDGSMMSDCPICNPDIIGRNKNDKPGHSNGKPLTHTSHAGHDHPATKSARAACRKAQAAKA